MDGQPTGIAFVARGWSARDVIKEEMLKRNPRNKSLLRS